jgi:hypothetical protein
LGFSEAGAGESVRAGAVTFATAGDELPDSLPVAAIEPKFLTGLTSAIVDGAAGEVDKTAVLSSTVPNCRLLVIADIGAAAKSEDVSLVKMLRYGVWSRNSSHKHAFGSSICPCETPKIPANS